MGTQYAFGQIVMDGLVLCLNASDRNSYVSGSTTWNDVSGRGNNGTLTNGPTFNSLNGGSIVFDGVNDNVIGSISSTTFSNASTMCCWFNRQSVTQWSGLISNNVGTTSCPILTFIDNTNIVGTNQAGINANYIGVDLGSNYLNKWVYCVLTYSGSLSGSTVNVYVYKDGSITTASGILYWNLSTNSQYYIGRHWTSATEIFNGRIASAQIYNRALSAQEVLQNYNATKSRFGIT
jgi:hypothetical protein